MNRIDNIYDVIIVGCGPVGAFAANALGRLGHEVLVLEQGSDAYPLPRAVHIDHEMVRLFHRIGLTDDILPRMREAQGHLHLGADGGVIRYMGSHGRPKRFAWANDYFFFQPELEASLRAGMARYPNVDFRQNVMVTGIESEPGAQFVTVDCTYAHGTVNFSGRFVVACDGARSTVRKSLGIALEDLGFEEAWLVVDADVDGPINFPPVPGLPEGADLQTLSVMACDPLRPATIVPGRGQHRRWEFMLLPGETEVEMTRQEVVDALVGPWLTGCNYEILRKATYRFHGLVASRWRQGRVFLAGDAAHQTPPFFGQGMCHGLRDVSNLSFKLDLVLRGLADASLLDSYESERNAQVRHVIGEAVAAGRYICELDPVKAAHRDEDIRCRQREGRDIATAADLITPYVSGFVAPGGGQRFVQPWVGLPDGSRRRLDEVISGDFALISQGEDIVSKLSPAATDQLRRLGVQPCIMGKTGDFTDAEGFLEQEFASRHACHVLIRPDFYVYGWAADLETLERMIASLDLPLGQSCIFANERLPHNA